MTKQTILGKGWLRRMGSFGCSGLLQSMLVSGIVLEFGLRVRAQSYMYQFTAPINGWFQQGAADPAGLNGVGPGPWGGIGNIFDFGSLSETILYNPTASTVQQMGSFTLDSTGFTGSFEDDKNVNGSLVPGLISVSYTLNNGNDIVSFNSGVQPVGENPTLNWSIPFSETITLATGGQYYVDTISGSIPEANDITSISQMTPGSVVISQGYRNINMNIGNQYCVGFNASDGWSGTIFDGIGDGSLPYYYSVSPITAYAVPEPGSVTMFVMGALGIFALRRKKQ